MSQGITETQFNELVDNILLNIEEQLDELETDVDYEINGGILTLTMPNGSQIIINRQTANKQLWLAAKSGGYHYVYNEQQNQWLDTRTHEPFIEGLNRCLSEQSDEEFYLTLPE